VKSYVYGDPYIPQEFRDAETGLRPSMQELLDLIDMDDPTWPATAAVLREMAEAGVEIDKAALAIASKLGAHRLANLDEVKISPRDPWRMVAIGSIVYYIRRGPVIKIGWSGAPGARFLDLLPDEILAFEPGGVKEETFRHRQFAHLRCRNEYFRPAPELMEHIRLTREAHGDPHPDWPTIAVMAKPAPPRDNWLVHRA